MRKLVVLLSMFAVGLNIGCREDLLESTPYGLSTSADFWRNGEDVVAAVNAIYEPLRDHDFYGHSEHTFSIVEDDQWRAGDHSEDQSIEELTYDPSNPQLAAGWRSKYEMISRANAVLVNAPGVEMDEDLRNRSLGEAHFLRGFSYWRLHVIYGGTPIILEEDVLAGNFNKPKASIDEMRSQIESDLLRAIELLPVNHGASEAGRVHRGTAYGLLTKLYVYQERWQDAIDSGEEVINGPYPLAPSFLDNFRIETENNPEMLFSVQALDVFASTAHRIYTTPRPWGGWDFHAPTQELVDEFEPADPRLDASLFLPGEMVDLGGDAGMQEYTTDLSQTGYHFQKFASWRTSGGLDGGQNVPILRSADVYLLVAEAKIRSGQNGDTELNAVRARVGLDPKTNATMEDIIHERRVELAGENQRYFDLLRWDKANIVDIVALLAEDRGNFNPPITFDRNKHYYFAIPQREIDVSNGILEQNDGFL